MNPAEIKKALVDQDMTQLDVVKRLKMPLTARPIVSLVINGKARSQRVEREIAKITGYPLHELWPDWYRQDGRRLKAQRAA